ncbi:MAG: hypothetical protein HYT76_02575 [Deltaproteobacteria bacterium]|nr:hypothetical protein [Deltaproteobacteria bacterium]
MIDLAFSTYSSGKNGLVFWRGIKENYSTEPIESAHWLSPVPKKSEEGEWNPDGSANPLHFYNQLWRIPAEKSLSERSVMQIALNIGQGLASGSVNKRWSLRDFVLFDQLSTGEF